jgi:hypothetical protein
LRPLPAFFIEAAQGNRKAARLFTSIDIALPSVMMKSPFTFLILLHMRTSARLHARKTGKAISVETKETTCEQVATTRMLAPIEKSTWWNLGATILASVSLLASTRPAFADSPAHASDSAGSLKQLSLEALGIACWSRRMAE